MLSTLNELRKVNCFVYCLGAQQYKFRSHPLFWKTGNFHKYCFSLSIFVFAIVRTEKSKLLCVVTGMKAKSKH